MKEEIVEFIRESLESPKNRVIGDPTKLYRWVLLTDIALAMRVPVKEAYNLCSSLLRSGRLVKYGGRGRVSRYTLPMDQLEGYEIVTKHYLRETKTTL